MQYPDKNSIIGYCSRLAISIDPAILAKEVDSIPADNWKGTGGRVGVHSQVNAIFLRGYAPAEGDKPIEDRPVLDALPYIRYLIYRLIPARPQRCLLARLKPDAQVAAHKDMGEYFDRYIRIHFPVVTNPTALMLCGDRAYHMKPGEIWALNNSGATHAVVNPDKKNHRTHMICDFEPTDALLELLSFADKGLGVPAAARRPAS